MNILLIDGFPDMEKSLQALGHSVHSLRLRGGVFYLPGILAGMDCAPDLVVQVEALGVRSYFGGLERLACPTVFLAVDAHLNMFWHRWYALLFDAVLTPHVSLFEALPGLWRPGTLVRFAQAGQRREWQAHAQRELFMSFCGRLTEHRPVRGWLVDLLLPLGLRFADSLTHENMMRLYDTSRVVPNESIANEVNFRLTEGASAGCLVLSPDVGEDQNALFAPDKEFLVYHDGLELLEQVNWARANPEAAEKIGQAAMRRVQREHLPEHRARTLLDVAAHLSQQRLTGLAADFALWITLAKQIRGRGLGLDAKEYARQGLAMVYNLPPWRELPSSLQPFASQVISQALCLFAEVRDGSAIPEALMLCRNLLAEEGAPAGALEVAGPASALALRENLFSLAQAFWVRHAGKAGVLPPKDAFALCLAWSGCLRKNGDLLQVGFSFEGRGLPECAFSWLLFARRFSDKDSVFRECGTLFAGAPGMVGLRLGFLAQDCLAAPDDWRVQFTYGHACILACRVREGLFELAEARRKAEAEGKGALFTARLSAHDLHGDLTRALER